MKSSKKVAIVLGHSVQFPFEKTGGVEKNFINIFKEIDSSESFDLLMICRADKRDGEILNIQVGKRIHFLKGFDWTNNTLYNLLNSIRWVFKIRKLIFDYDLILFNTLFGPVLFKFMRYKGLITFCDQRGSGKVGWLLPDWSLDRIYCISEYVKSVWLLEGRTNIKVIYNNVDTDCFKKTTTMVQRNGKEYHLLFIGRITKEKGLIYLLKAVSILNKEYNINLNLSIVGNKEYLTGEDRLCLDECEKFVKSNNLTNCVSFLGEKNSEEINLLLNVSDILVVPSIWDEAFGIVNIEALATGTPVVGFKKGAIPEIVQDGYNGFIVNTISDKGLSNVLLQYFKLGEKEKQTMSLNAIASVKKYDSKQIAQEYLGDFKKLLNS